MNHNISNSAVEYAAQTLVDERVKHKEEIIALKSKIQSLEDDLEFERFQVKELRDREDNVEKAARMIKDATNELRKLGISEVWFARSIKSKCTQMATDITLQLEGIKLFGRYL